MVVLDGLWSKMPVIVEDEDEEGDEGLPADVITTFDEAIHGGNNVLAFLTKGTLCRIFCLFSLY